MFGLCLWCTTVAPGTDTVLIMCASNRTCELLGEYLASMDVDAEPGMRGRKMMEKKLRGYVIWKGNLNGGNTKPDANANAKRGATTSTSASTPQQTTAQAQSSSTELSEGLRRKDAAVRQRNQNRRRVRGGAPATATASGSGNGNGGGVSDVSASASAFVENAASAKEREKFGILLGEGEMRNEADEIAELCVFFIVSFF